MPHTGNVIYFLGAIIIMLVAPSRLQGQEKYDLTVQASPRQTFKGIGASQVYIWEPMNTIPEKERIRMTDMVFRDLGFNILRMWLGTGPKETVNTMKAKFYSQYGNVIGEIRSRDPGLNTLLLAPARGESQPADSMSAYAMKIARFILEVRQERGIRINVTGIANEPLHWSIQQVVDATKYLRKELDDRGLQDVRIISPECASNDGDLNRKLDGLHADTAAWEAMDGIASHSYNMAVTDAQAGRTYGRDFWMTEASNNGNEGAEDEDMACVAAARFLNDMNHLVTHWVWFVGFANSRDVATDKDNATKLMVYDQARREIFIHLKYYYFKQLLTTFDKGAVFRSVMSSREADMPYTYGQKPAINAAAAINPDGTWAVGIVNGTGVSSQSHITKWYDASNCVLNIKIDELKGTASLPFVVFRSSANRHAVISDTILVRDGRFTISLAPRELVTLRSIKPVNPITARGQVTAIIDTMEIPTYLTGGQEKFPVYREYRFPGEMPFRSDRQVYPYTLQDKFTTKKEMKKYEAITLENEYLKVVIIPDLRGRIQGAVDKRNGWDFLYYNHVIKPADISIRQAWIAGGLEWNHPQGHGYTQFQRISHKVVEESDGGKTIIVSEIEPNRQMKWEMEITLHPGKLYLETRGRFISIAPYPVPFVSAQNGAMHITDETEIIFPKGTYVTGHGKHSYIQWPDGKGVDLSRAGNIKNVFSSFADGAAVDQDFFGCYTHESDAGTVIVSDHRNAPGKKFFTWGAHPGGKIWDHLLTDTDGSYLELQLVAFRDNLGYGYSWLDPGEIKEFTAYWYPVMNTDGFVKASREVCLNLEKSGQKEMKIAVQSTRDIVPAVIMVKSGNRVLMEKKTGLLVSVPFITRFKLPEGIDEQNLDVSIVGNDEQELLSYSTRPSVGAPPQPSPGEKPLAEMTPDELYHKGKSFYQDPFSPDAENCYLEMLKRGDMQESRAHLQLGILYWHRGLYEKSAKHFEEYLRRDPLNEDSYTAHLYLGMIGIQAGDLANAREELNLAGRNRTSGYNSLINLSRISFLEKKYTEGIGFLEEAAHLYPGISEPWRRMAAGYRKSGMEGKAAEAAEYALKTDPLDFGAMAEKWLLGKFSSDSIHFYFDRHDSTFVGSDLYLVTASDYMESGDWQDASAILETALDHFGKKGYTYALLEYYLGYCNEKEGNAVEAAEHYTKGSGCDPSYIFPYRKMTAIVLRSALNMNPSDGHAWMYLGNLLTGLRRNEEGLEAWNQAFNYDKNNPVLLRNIAGASWYLYADTAKTIDLLKAALNSEPDDEMVLNDLDHMYEFLGRTDKRMNLFEKYDHTVENNDVLVYRYVTLLLRLGYENLHLRKYTEAGNFFRKASGLMDSTYFFPREASSNLYIRYAEAYYGQGEVLLEQERAEEALTYLEKGMEMPSNLSEGFPSERMLSRVNYLMGKAWQETGDKAKADSCFRKVTDEKNGALTEAEIYRALALREMGQADEARDCLENLKRNLMGQLGEVSARPQKKATLCFLLSRTLEVSGKKKEAEKYRQLADKYDPDAWLQVRTDASFVPWTNGL